MNLLDNLPCLQSYWKVFSNPKPVYAVVSSGTNTRYPPGYCLTWSTSKEGAEAVMEHIGDSGAWSIVIVEHEHKINI